MIFHTFHSCLKLSWLFLISLFLCYDIFFRNETANTITRAVLKTGGGSSSGKEEFSMEGLDAEKLKGIEPKMVELIMNEVFKVQDSTCVFNWVLF